MSQTPRTDAKAQFFGFNPDEGEEFVQADFARELERENAALRNEVDEQARLNGKGAEREFALRAKVEMLERGNAALEKLIIEAGYIITNFNGAMALCRDPWHQPKEVQP